MLRSGSCSNASHGDPINHVSSRHAAADAQKHSPLTVSVLRATRESEVQGLSNSVWASAKARRERERVKPLYHSPGERKKKILRFSPENEGRTRKGKVDGMLL